MAERIHFEDFAVDIERLTDRAFRASRAALFTAAVNAKAIARQAAPEDQGKLKRGFVVSLTPTGARLENVEPHATPQEHGTRPFTPPRGPLLAWARRKVARGRGRGRGSREQQAQRLAAGAIRSIQRRGIIPKRFFAKAASRFGALTDAEMLKAHFKVRR